MAQSRCARLLEQRGDGDRQLPGEGLALGGENFKTLGINDAIRPPRRGPDQTLIWLLSALDHVPGMTPAP